MIDPPHIMKRHLQWAEQQKAASNFSKYCACHAKWISGLIPHRIWNVILQCAEQEASPSNVTKYCACHAKWISWLIHITYETSFTVRGATVNTLQPHQILRLPRKMNLMIDPHHIWNVIYNARSNSQPHQILCLPRKMNLMIDPHHIWNVIYNSRSNSQHPPTSPNTAPATQNDHPRSDRNLPKTAETSFPMRDRSDHDPRPIRDRSDHDPTQKTQNWTRRAAKATFRTRQEHILIENYNVSPTPAIIPNFTTCCACHEKWHMNFTKCCACHEKVTHELHQMLPLPRKVTHELHQMLRLPRKVTRSDTWLILLLLLLLLLTEA